jgi:hypothetical protein
VSESGANYELYTGLQPRKEFDIKSTVKLTSWSSALLEKLPIMQLLKNLPAFYGT